MAPSCFALQVPGVRGLQARGRHVLLSCSNFAHERSYVMCTYTSLGTKPFEGSGSETIRTHIGYTRSWSRSQAVRFQATHSIAS